LITIIHYWISRHYSLIMNIIRLVITSFIETLRHYCRIELRCQPCMIIYAIASYWFADADSFSAPHFRIAFIDYLRFIQIYWLFHFHFINIWFSLILLPLTLLHYWIIQITAIIVGAFISFLLQRRHYFRLISFHAIVFHFRHISHFDFHYLIATFHFLIIAFHWICIIHYFHFEIGLLISIAIITTAIIDWAFIGHYWLFHYWCIDIATYYCHFHITLLLLLSAPLILFSLLLH